MSNPRVQSRRRKAIFSIGATIVASALVFLTGEVWVRWSTPVDDAGWYELHSDPVLFYRLVPEKVGVDHGARRTHTSQRIRGPNRYTEFPPDRVQRWLWIGDSSCFGHGVADDQTAPAEFSRQASAAGLEAESINLGVVGYNVRQIREVLSQRSAEFRGASTVVYLHHENDIINVPWTAVAAHMPSALFWDYEPPQPFHRKLLKRSALVRRVWNSAAVVQWFGPGEGNEFDPELAARILADRTIETPIHPFTRRCVSLYDSNERLGGQFRGELEWMVNHSRSIDAKFMFVYWPSRTLLHHEELRRLRTTLLNWCRELDIAFVDATDAFLASRATDLYFDAVHPGAGGYRLIAELVLEQQFVAAGEVPVQRAIHAND